MVQQTISTGTSANDGTGDTLRSAGTKINQNFTEVYGLFPTRVSETMTTGTLADSADGTVSFSNLGRSFILTSIKPNKAAYIRIYTDDSSRTADTGRGQMFANEGAIGYQGIIWEGVTSADSSIKVAPGLIGYIDSPGSTLPARIRNLSGGSSTVQVTINATKLES